MNQNTFKSNYFIFILPTLMSLLLIFKLSSVQRIDSVSQNQESNSVKRTKTIAEVKNVPSGKFDYGGSVCFAPLVREGFHKAIKKAYPLLELNYVEPAVRPGCGAEIQPLLQKNFSFLLNTRSPNLKEYELARKRGIDLGLVLLGTDSVAVYTHKSNEVDHVTLEQLRDIYLGKITNWQELGGSNNPIIPVSLYPTANTDLQVLMQLDDENIKQLNLSKSTEFVRDYTNAIRLVSKTPGAISLASSAIVKGQNSIKPLALARNDASIPVSAILADRSINLKAIKSKSYPLTRQLWIVFRDDPTTSKQIGIAYSNFLQSEQGQKFLEQAGFVPRRQ